MMRTASASDEAVADAGGCAPITGVWRDDPDHTPGC